MPTAEPGTSTSEWQLVLGALGANVIALAVAFGVHLSGEQQTAILACVGSVTALVSAYALSRGLRKAGSNG